MLNTFYEEASKNIDDAVNRAEKLAILAKTEEQAKQLANYQRLVLLNSPSDQTVSLPYSYLPFSKNPRFLGRQVILDSIEKVLQPANRDLGFTAVMIHGLGGIGKTQIALAYAYSKLDSVGVVIFIPSESHISLDRTFTEVAVKGLKLPGATAQDKAGNRALVLDWFQRTGMSLSFIQVIKKGRFYSQASRCYLASYLRQC
jgi:hypothetical protein